MGQIIKMVVAGIVLSLVVSPCPLSIGSNDDLASTNAEYLMLNTSRRNSRREAVEKKSSIP